MSLNGDKLLCSLYINVNNGREEVRYDKKEVDYNREVQYGKEEVNYGGEVNFRKAPMTTLNIYSNGILMLTQQQQQIKPVYYKSTITEEDLNIILKLCNDILPTDLNQCNSHFIYYEYKNQPTKRVWPDIIPEYNGSNQHPLMNIINQTYQIKYNLSPPKFELSEDKLLCSLYIKESAHTATARGNRSEYFVLSTLKIYNNKILVLDIAKSNPDIGRGHKPEFTVSSTSYYKSTITEEDLNIILNLCESNVLPPYLKQCMAKDSNFIYYEYNNHPVTIEWPDIPEYNHKYNNGSDNPLMGIINQTYQIKNNYKIEEMKLQIAELQLAATINSEMKTELKELKTELIELKTELQLVKSNAELNNKTELNNTELQLVKSNTDLEEQLILAKATIEQMLIYFKESTESQLSTINAEIKHIEEIHLEEINVKENELKKIKDENLIIRIK